jgi:hypothetical protein
MKITAKKIRREMTKNYGWNAEMQAHNEILINEAIKDVLTIVNKILIEHKNISIK